MPTATSTTKGPVTIPKEVREHLGIDTGDRLSFVVQEDGTVMVKPLTRHVRELADCSVVQGSVPCRSARWMRASLGACMRSSDDGDDRPRHQRPGAVSDARRSGTICEGGRFHRRCERTTGTVSVNTPVLCELVWVLAAVYDYSREEIAEALEQIFTTAQFEIERLDEARQALGDFRSSKADFSDALIGRINRSLGAKHTVTFDRDLKAVETFRLL